MANLEVTYAGLKLENPLIVSSSGLTGSLPGVKKAAEAGAGAIVLKSIFEEQIFHNAQKECGEHTEGVDALSNYYLTEYLELISKSKKEVSAPIIASINCLKEDRWVEYSKACEGAGADAIELNLMILAERQFYVNTPFEENFFKNSANKPNIKASELLSAEEVEAEIVKIVKKVAAAVKIPVTVKIPPYFTSLESFAQKLSDCCIKGIVFFNNLNPPDFSLDTFEPVTDIRIDHPELMYHTLRWVGLLEGRIGYDISASGGVYDEAAAIKMILAGANSVQLCSTLYKNGVGELSNILSKMEQWMDKKGYASISEMRGDLKEKMGMELFRRTQYMKMYNIKE